MDLTIDFTDLLKSFLVAFGPVLTDFLVDLESADESESEASDSLSSSTNESSSSTTLF